MESDDDLSMLAPVRLGDHGKAEERRLYRGLKRLSEKVAKAAVIKRPAEDLIMQVYMAGIWHGAELQRREDAARAEKEGASNER